MKHLRSPLLRSFLVAAACGLLLAAGVDALSFAARHAGNLLNESLQLSPRLL